MIDPSPVWRFEARPIYSIGTSSGNDGIREWARNCNLNRTIWVFQGAVDGGLSGCNGKWPEGHDLDGARKDYGYGGSSAFDDGNHPFSS